MSGTALLFKPNFAGLPENEQEKIKKDNEEADKALTALTPHQKRRALQNGNSKQRRERIN